MVFCNKTRILSTYKYHQSNHIINEFLESFACHFVPPIICNRKRVWLYSYRFFIDPLRMGARCNRRFGHIEQSPLAVVFVTFQNCDSFGCIKSVPDSFAFYPKYHFVVLDIGGLWYF